MFLIGRGHVNTISPALLSPMLFTLVLLPVLLPVLFFLKAMPAISLSFLLCA